ncbi:hypothetical protein [Marinobacter salicampi]|uniref:hypothetical protein n=1 Tax=Marinobacter salicampi TaxID=435907 RepID=UPI00140C7613|nr:hypothetical protein [Marinobacter salicampi]
MQGIRFRKYIRKGYFDLNLFASDLVISLQQDGCPSATPWLIHECFESAQLLGWAEEGQNYALETAEGCFGLYSHAMGLVGSRIEPRSTQEAGSFYRDDSWVDESWPTVEAVVDHLNAQMAQALSVDDDQLNHYEAPGDPGWGKVQTFIQSALGTATNQAQHSAVIYKIS